MLRRMLSFSCFCIALSTTLSAQILPVGSIDGTVKDPTSALVPSVQIVLKNTKTGVTSSTTTNDSGYFFFRLVNPGTYEVSAEHAGFKKALQQVSVRVGMRSTADFTLEIGAVSQSLQVTTRAPLLETSTSGISRNVEQRAITNVPLMDRNVLMLINLAPGITNNTPTGNTNGLIDIDNVSYTSANGANNRENEFLMDGIPNNVTDRVAYIPTVDDVQEFTVQTNSLDAEYGHGGGMYVNVTSKGGTNEFHGALWEFDRNNIFNANTFFANKNGSPRPVLRFNQFGLTSGGPIIKDKLFYFFTYEGLRQRTPTTYRFTVPTDLQRQGNFSQTYDKNGNLMQIADPLTTCGTGNNPACAVDSNGKPIYTRQLFSGNIIPTGRINPVAAAVISRYPNPTSNGDPFTGANNYFAQVPAPYDGSNYSLRIDPNFHQHHLFVRWSHNSGFPGTPTPWDIGGGVGQLEGNSRAQTSLGLSDVFTVSPTMAITAQLGFTRWTQIGTHPTFDPATLGFPSSLVSQLQQQEFPQFQIQDMYYIGASEGKWYEHTNTYSFNFGAIETKGSHNMKWGFQGQVKQNNSVPANRPAGQYFFDRGFTQPDPFIPGTASGNGIASFLLGYPSATSTSHVDLRTATATQSPYYGWYFQDDYKVTSNLTLNLGVRYDIILGATERYNHSALGFDPSIVSPIAAAAQTAYALNPIPELPVADFNALGGLMFATDKNRRNAVTDWSNLAPRIGLAYRLPHNTVLRAGFGIFYSGWWQPFTNSTGYAASTDMETSLDGGLTPANTLSDPFPSGLIPPTGSSLGAATLLGTSFSFYDYWRKNIRNYRWNFGFQHAITKDLQLEVNYVGQHATDLSTSTSAGDAGRVLNGSWNGTGGTFDQKYYSLSSRLSDKVPNPFYGLISAASPLGQSTITVGQLLEPFPEFGGLSLIRETGGAPQFGYNGGTSYYNSLQVSALQRLSHGLSAQLAYTYSRSIETLHYIEPSDPAPSKMIGQFDNPHRVSIGAVYELPFGHGQAFKSDLSAVNMLIGGWQWSSMFIYQSGYAWPLPPALATGSSPSISNSSIAHWFNGAALQVLPAFTARRNPYYWDNLRSPAINNWDMALIKDTPVYKERVTLEFRCEMLNAFNRVWFGGLDTNPLSATYTQLTSQANNPRYIQFGLKIIY
jgi:Carboxypeptidase regulatory-like domain